MRELSLQRAVRWRVCIPPERPELYEAHIESPARRCPTLWWIALLCSLAWHFSLGVVVAGHGFVQDVPQHRVILHLTAMSAQQKLPPAPGVAQDSPPAHPAPPLQSAPSVRSAPKPKTSLATKPPAKRTQTAPVIAVPRELARPGAHPPATAAPSSAVSPSNDVPSTQPTRSDGAPVVLANESGQDSLKHGAEARFMHGLATEEFVEENYVGEYHLGEALVWIEDDRARSGHLILHDGRTGIRRPLFRFNRFIYVYGENPNNPQPTLGSVTFFSDGSIIHQFLWQHNGTQAFFPVRLRQQP